MTAGGGRGWGLGSDGSCRGVLGPMSYVTLSRTAGDGAFIDSRSARVNSICSVPFPGVHIGETFYFCIDSNPRAARLDCLSQSGTRTLMTLDPSAGTASGSFEVKESGQFTVVVCLGDSGDTGSFLFSAIAPLGLLTNEQLVRADGAIAMEVQVRNLSTVSLRIDSLRLLPTEMYSVLSVEQGPIELQHGAVWQYALLLEQRIVDGAVMLSQDLGKIEVCWRNGEEPGRLQTALLRRKPGSDLPPLSVWLSPSSVMVGERTAVSVVFLNSTSTEATNVAFRYLPERLQWADLLPVGPVYVEVPKLGAGQRQQRDYTLIAYAKGEHRCEAWLQYTMDGVEHRRPQEFTVNAEAEAVGGSLSSKQSSP